MERKKLLLVINPVSGKGVIAEHLLEVVQAFAGKGYDVTVYPTSQPKDATKRMAAAHDFDLIVVCGGDGTLNEAVTGIIEHDVKVPLGYLPMGTANDFSQSLCIPKNIEEAVRICLEGQAVSIDVGNFNDRIFNYVAAFGAFTDVSYETPQLRKKRMGSLAYVIEGILKLSTIQPYHCRIEASEGSFEGEYIFGMVSNSDSVAGIKNAFGTTAELSDGLFEVTLVKNPRSPLQLRRILLDLLCKNYDPEYVTVFKTSKLQIESEAEMKWTLDGEAGGFHQHANIKNMNQRISMMVGQLGKGSI